MKLVTTAEGYQYWIPEPNEVEGNPLYSAPPEQTNVQPSSQFSLPVELPSGDDVSDLPTFKIQTLGKPKDTRSKEEKLAEMFGVVPGPEGPLDIVKSFVSGLTAPGEVVKGEVEQGDLLSRAIDTAGLGITGPLGIKPGTASLGSGMTRPKKFQNYLQLDHMLDKAKSNELRGLIDEKGNIHFWDAYDLTHQDAANQLGLNYNINNRIHLRKSKDDPGYSILDFDDKWTHSALSNPQFLKLLNKKDILVDSPGQGLITGPEFVKMLKSDTSNVGKAVSVAQHAKPFFTNVEASLAKIPMKSGTAEQWTNAFKRYGAGKEELQYAVGELPAGQITRQQIEQHLKDNAVQLNEVWKGASKFKTRNDWSQNLFNKNFDELTEAQQLELAGKIVEHNHENPTKYSQYQMPGGTNYRELLLTLPEKIPQQTRQQYQLFKDGQMMAVGDETAANRWKQRDPNADVRLEEIPDTRIAKDSPYVQINYSSSHWDEPNVIAHIRMNDRIINEPGFTVVNRKSGFKGKSFRTKEEAEAGLKEYPESIRGDLVIKESQLPTKTLHLEEIQSDWHQAGRKQGYSKPNWKAEFDRLEHELGTARGRLAIISEKTAEDVLGMSFQKFRRENPDPVIRQQAIDKLNEYRKNVPEFLEAEKNVANLERARNEANLATSLPDAPFKSNWDELALKKAIRVAVEQGYDAISWTPGKHQSTNPSKHIEKIKFNVTPEGEYRLYPYAKNGDEMPVPKPQYKANELEELVGKDIAKKIIEEGKTKNFDAYGLHEIDNANLDIGGTKEFYDKILVDKANKLVKPFGGKVEEKHLPLRKDEIEHQKRVLRDNTPPDEIALKEHKEKWDELVSDINKLREENQIHKGKSDIYIKAGRARLHELENELDALHKRSVDETVERKIKAMQGNKVFTVKLTPELKKHALEKGFSLFSATPVYIPVEGDPFARQTKLVPVTYNPFALDE